MFKKIMTVIAGAVMIGSTMGFAAAAVGSNNVFGDNTNIVAPGSSDSNAATGLQDYIGSLNINETVITNETITEGERVAIKTSSQPLYLGDNMSETKSTFTDTQLPNVLASGEVDGDDGKDYEYNLKIDVPTSITKYGEPEDSTNKAIVYSDFSNDESYKLRIIFPTAVDVKELAGEQITLFGREFTFSEDEGDLDNTSVTLFEKSSSVMINSGETKNIEGHAIRADIEDTNSATIYVDGVSKNVNDNDWSGKIGGVNVYVKNIHAPNVEGLARYVQISLNAEKLTLSDGDEVERGTSEVDGTNVEIKTSGEKVREIAITVTPNDIEDVDDDNVEYLGVGDYLIDPVFKTIKFSFDSVTPDLKSEDRDYIKVKTSSDDAVIDFTNKAGKDYNFEFVDDSILNFAKADAPEGGYFITASNEYSQVWKIIDMDSTEIRVKDQGDDSDYLDLTIDDSGNAELPLADGGTATLNVNFGDNKVNSAKMVDYVFTKNGAQISLSRDSVNITEETRYNGGTFTNNSGNELGSQININLDYSGDDLKLDLDNPRYTYDDDDDDMYAMTRYGTYIKEHDGEKIEIYYPESAMELNFHIGEIESNVTSQQAVSEGKVSRVVLGGSCINAEASRLLGVGQLCGSEFSQATGVQLGQYMIKTFADPDNSGKVAVLVAGYDAADTQRGVQFLIDNEGFIDFTSTEYSRIA